MNTKKLTLALMGATLLSANALADPELVAYDVNGDGTTEEGEQAYKITSADDLYWFAGLVNGKLDGVDQNTAANAYLAESITINANVLVDGKLNPNEETVANFKEWFPIGYYYKEEKDYVYYKGTFDGNGKTVSGLYFNDPNTDLEGVGLFGNIESPAVIKNVGVIDSYFNGENDIASVCGYNNGGTFENCYNTSVVNGNNFVGGVCGYNESAITNCYNTGSVKGSGNNVGGVCGYNYDDPITNCYNTGAVSGSVYIGGVCGENECGTITNCYDFKLNGGTINGYSIVVDNNKITLPADVTLVGKAFEGWYKKDNFEGSAIVSEDAGFNEVHTLYAKWVESIAPTAIKAVETENNKTIKTIKDGQIVIIRNGVMYDMNGRKL